MNNQEYKYYPPKGEIIWIKLIKPYEGDYKSHFPENMKVGDITWANIKGTYNSDFYFFPEGNRYKGNFNKSFFEEVDIINYNKIYEIY